MLMPMGCNKSVEEKVGKGNTHSNIPPITFNINIGEESEIPSHNFGEFWLTNGKLRRKAILLYEVSEA